MESNQDKDRSSENLEKNQEYNRNNQKNEAGSKEFATPKFSEDDFEKSEDVNHSEHANRSEQANRSGQANHNDFREQANFNVKTGQDFSEFEYAEKSSNEWQNRAAEEKTSIHENSGKDAVNEKTAKNKKDGSKKASLKDKIANANIKQIFLVIMGAIVVFLAVWGLMDIINTIRAARNPMLTPETATRHLVSSISADDYEEFQKLVEPINNIDNEKNLYDKLKKSLETSKDNLVTNFVMIKLENGEQYLCSFYYDDKKAEYVFRSIVEIPVESQGFFAR